LIAIVPRCEELVDDGIKGGEFVGGKLLFADTAEFAAFEGVEREVNLCAAYVASENHLLKLQRTYRF
jgi:hypothetical protein